MQTFNSNFKEFGVVESKRNAIRRGFVHEMLNAQDTVLCSCFAHRAGTKTDGCGQKSVDVRRLKQDERTRVWQPESSVEGSRWCRALLTAPKN